MSKNLIVPVAKKSDKNDFPYVFGFNTEGVMLCVKAILGLELSQFSNIFFVILKEHDKLFNIKTLLEMQFKQCSLKNAKVIVLEEQTMNQPETVYKAVKQEKIDGSVFIKDADGFFKCGLVDENGLAVYSLEEYDSFINLKNKSFVYIDDNFYITNVIEKRIIGKYINVGGYFFEDIKQFCSYYEEIGAQRGLYLSHIVYAMLLDRIVFRPIEISDFDDWDARQAQIK